MGLFTKRQMDRNWLIDIRPPYEAARSVISDLDRAMDDNSLEDQIRALQGALNQLPLVAQAVKDITEPTSAEARTIHKALQSALKNYIEGSKQGRIFFGDEEKYAGHGDRRKLNKTELANRAAVGRLSFSKNMFAELSKSGRQEMKQVSDYLERARG